ncbi:hypothetical protein [Melittangium boletus]|uniref:Uncharacterized protein n=1 Tax=Melittangium boletus DSM 14713 TaxID=1294270 RepID=A0A250ITF3_9BACT|nr:hypothetical protein [Melittangium boletus]ATB34520.1 hypothetical protein MEBOL_008025 [Melittangium boletus DSM 14713]
MKTSTPPAASGSPFSLRLVHGILFGGFTAICVVVGSPEFEQLLRAQRQVFHAGPPPRVEVMLAVLAALLGMGVILVQALRGRSARLPWSVLILGALGLVLWRDRAGPVPGRTADSANLKILQTARALHGLQIPELQNRGALEEDVEAWRVALQKVTHGEPTPVRTRSFEPLAYHIQKVDKPDTLPEGVPPGTLLLYVMEGGIAYELQAIGISPEGEPWRLQLLPAGEPVVFRGAFNPEIDTRPPQMP